MDLLQSSKGLYKKIVIGENGNNQWEMNYHNIAIAWQQ